MGFSQSFQKELSRTAGLLIPIYKRIETFRSRTFQFLVFRDEIYEICHVSNAGRAWWLRYNYIKLQRVII